MKQGWTGVLIEPIPYYFFELKKNRSKKNYFFQCALVPFSHTSRNIDMVQAGAMSIATELELDIIDVEAHLATARGHLEKYQDERKLVKRILVPARTLNSILIECNSPEVIDFLSLDVEGAELDVLRGVDFNRYRFRYIVIESRNFKNTIAFMCERQYKLLKTLSVSDLLFGFEENESNS